MISKIKNVSIKSTSFLLSILMFLSCFASLSNFIKPIEVNAETLNNGFPCFLYAYNTTGKIKYTYGSYVTVLYVANGTKSNPTNCRYLYCLEPGTPLNNSNTLTSTTASAWNKLNSNQKKAISTITNFGISGFVKNEYSASNGSSYVRKDWGGEPGGSYEYLKEKFPGLTDDQFYVATQLLIWEVKSGYRDPLTFEVVDSSKRPSTAKCYMFLICGNDKNDIKNPGVYKVYYNILDRLKAFSKNPSMIYSSTANYKYKSGSSVSDTSTTSNPKNKITLSYISNDETYVYFQKTVNDTKKVLNFYSFNDGVTSQTVNEVKNALTISKGDNSLTIKLKLKKDSADDNLKLNFSKTINNAMRFNSSGSSTVNAYFSSLSADTKYSNYQDVLVGDANVSKNISLNISASYQMKDNSSLDLRVKKSIASNSQAWKDIIAASNGEQEIDGDVDDPELLSGWYFQVKLTSGKYSGKSYLLGPTDEKGYTKNTLAEAIGIEHLPGQSFSYEITELGFPTGAGTYYIPNSLKPYGGKATISGTINYNSNNNTVNCVTFANIWSTVIAIKKSSADYTSDNDTSAGYYFRIWDSEMKNALALVGPTKADGEYVFSGSPVPSSTKGKRFEAGTYYIEELGLKKDDGTYYIPEYYTPDAGIVTEDGRYFHKVVASPENSRVVTYNGSTRARVITDNWFNSINGKLKIKKIDEDNKKPLAGVSFAIFERDPSSISQEELQNLVKEYNNDSNSLTGIVDIVTTNSEGIATTSENKIFQFAKDKYYYVREISTVSGWELSNDTYTICAEPFDTNEAFNKEDLSCTIELTNSVANDRTVKVQKVTEDNLPRGGWQIRLTGKLVNGSYYNQTKITNSFGVVTFSNLAYGSYTIREVSVPNNVVITGPSYYNFTITEDSEKEQIFTFNNALKKWSATLTKTDSETTIAQGDATLAGAVYGLYNDGELVASYTTDTNGSFTTGTFPCGDYWTIKEISPSEGYLLDETEYHVGAESKKYTLEYNKISVDVKEDIIKGRMTIIKSATTNSSSIREDGAEFEVYLKSAGSYEKAKESERDILVTDKFGIAESKLLPYGIYTVHQTKAWSTHNTTEDFSMVVDKNGQSRTFFIYNYAKTTSLKVVKKDSETGKTVALAGFGFKIYDYTDDKYFSCASNGSLIDIFYTNSKGEITLPVELAYGKYALIEEKAGIGYVKDSTPVPFEISDATIKDNMVVVEKYNTPQKAIISIEKTGEGFISVNSSSTESKIYTPIYGNVKLAGAEFKIIANEDIRTADGTIRYKKDSVVSTVVTGKDGKAKTSELYLGSYRIVETKTPSGYVKNSTPINVELAYSNQEQKVNIFPVGIANTRKKVKVSLEKVLEKDSTFDIGDNDEILSVVFGLYANEDIVAPDGTKIPAGGLIETGNVTENGSLKFASDLPAGKYYVKEISTDEHYVLDNKKYEFEFNYDNSDEAVQNIDVSKSPIANTLKHVGLSGRKIDEEGNALSGATIGLFPITTTEFTKENAFLTSVSDNNGYFSFKNVPVGSYIVREISAPFGYKVSTKSYPVTVNKDTISTVVLTDVVNSLLTANLKIVKYSEDGVVSNVSFKVVSSTGATYNCTTNEEGIAFLDSLPIYNETEKITYTVTETNVPSRYITPSSKNIQLQEDKSSTVTFSNNLKKSDLIITKYAEDKEVSGLSFVVKAPDGTEYTGKTGFNGQLIFKDLPVYDIDNNAITYTVYENNVPVKYITPSKQSTSLVFGKNTTISFNNNYKKGNILIIKESEDSDISNKSFVIKGSDGSKYEGNTDKNGKLFFKNLNMYDKSNNLVKYTIYEDNVPIKYVVPSTQKISISGVGKTEEVKFVNNLKKGNLIINKESEDSSIDNKKFVVKGSDNSEYTGVTNKNGVLSFNNLPVYDYNNKLISYTVYEDDVPSRYVVPSEQITTIEADEDTTLTFKNILKKGDLVITKFAEDNEISGLDFVVKSPDGTEYTGKTNNEGQLVFKDLPVYDSNNSFITYTVYENNVPIKYITPATQSASLIFGEAVTLSFTNNYKKGNILIVKESEDSDVSDKVFVIKGSDGSKYEGKTNANGDLIFNNLNMYDKSNNLITYRIYEDNVPLKYVVPSEQEISISDAGRTEKVKFTNNLKKGNIVIVKQSEDLDISNKSFVVRGSDGSEYTGLTNEEGKLFFNNLPVYDYNSEIITYTVYENNVPIKYVIPEEQTTSFETDEDTVLTFVNNLKKGTLIINKEAEDHDIKGRDFVIEGSDGSKYTGSTDKNGLISFKNLPIYDYDNNLITYTVYEDNIPVKYVSPEQQTTSFENSSKVELTFENNLKETKLTIQKESEDNEVSGLEFVLEGSDGSRYSGKTDEDGFLVFDNLSIYDYNNKLIEYTIFENNVPIKYVIPDEQDISFETEEDVTLYFTNKFKRSSIVIVKESEDNDIEGKEFVVRGSDGSEYKGKTDASGNVRFEDLVVYDSNNDLIQYTVYEDNVPVKYVVPAEQCTYIEFGKDTTLTFVNNLKKSSLIIKKESEDKDVKDKEFIVKGSDGYETKVVTNEDGIINIENLNVYDYNNIPITYTIYEDNVPIKYIVPAEQTAQLQENTPTTVVFTNKLKRTKLVIQKESEDSDIANKDFVLKGSNGSTYNASTDNNGRIVFNDLLIYDYDNSLITYTVYEDNVPVKYVIPAEQTVTLKSDETDTLTFVNKFKRGSLVIIKESEDADISNKAFVVKDSLGNTFEGKTNDKGVLEFVNLLVYDSDNNFVKYTVYEDDVPVKYVVPAEQLTEINENKETTLTFKNNLKKGSLVIRKESEDKDIKDKTFVVKGSDGFEYKGTTNDNGIIELKNLNVYDYDNSLIAYTVYEDNVPVKYVVPDEQSVSLEADKTTEIVFKNKLKKTKLTITKESEDSDVKGKEFVVKGSDGSKYAGSTDENGIVVFKDLSIYDYDSNLIKYTVYEDNVPIKYIVPDEQDTTLSLENDIVLSFANMFKRGSLVVKKQSEDEDVANKEFVIKGSDGSFYTGKTDDSGILRFEDLLVYNSDNEPISYTVYEDNVPVKYIAPEEQNTLLKPAEDVTLTFNNNLKKASIKINKNSDDGNIADKEFVVKGSDGSEYKGKTDTSGIAVFENLNVYNYDNEKITYTVYEDNVPVQYLVPDSQEINLEWNIVSELTFVNVTKTSDVYIKKTDIVTSEGLPHCLVAIKDSDGNTVVQGYTDENGEITFEKLPYGKYTYQEVEAPEGYVIDTTPCEFEITEDGSIIKGELKDKKITGSITITKTDVATSEGLPNCLIVIKDSEGNIVVQGRTDASGNITFNELEYGKYTYQEVEAPEGYIIDTTPYEFEIKEDGQVIKATITNEKLETDTPPVQTGQNANNVVGASMLLLFSLSLLLISYYLSKRKKSD